MIPHRAYCFDAFGTLVEIADKTGALGRFLKMLGPQGARDGMDGLLRGRLGIRDLALAANLPSPEELAAHTEIALLREARSVRMIAGMAERWDYVRSTGARIAICSNLGHAYVEPLLNALPSPPDAAVMSCEVGLAKPDPAIYALVADSLSLAPAEIMFIGDTPAADYDGPRAAGMKAMKVETFRELTTQLVRAP